LTDVIFANSFTVRQHINKFSQRQTLLVGC
jgi:hypothetical protein